MDLIKLVEAKEKERLLNFRINLEVKPDADEQAQATQREEALATPSTYT
jgi:hypothetical protein